MPKIPVRMFRLPLISLVGHPFRRDEEEKNWWVNFQFLGEEFPLEDLAVLEDGKFLRAKNVRQEADGKQQLQFKGIAEKALRPGTKLYDSRWPVRQERKAYLVPLGAQNQKLTAEKAQLRSTLFEDAGLNVEIRKVDAPEEKYLIAVTAQRRFPCMVGHLYIVELPDGTCIDTALVTCGTVEARDLSDFTKKTFRFKGLPSVNALYSINLRVMGWVMLPPPLWDEEFEESEGKDGVRVMSKAFGHFQKKIRNAAAQPGGISELDLKEKMSLPEAVLNFLVSRLSQDGVIRKKDDWYLPVGDPKNFLSPIAKKALEQLDEFGVQGSDLNTVGSPLFKRTYEELARMDLAVQTETPWVYGLDAWSKIKTLLCGPGLAGKQWKIADVKELLEVSRKPILGILNRLESEGFLEWKEEYRLVVKEFQGE